jgi:carboxymethylenebutenolidase
MTISKKGGLLGLPVSISNRFAFKIVCLLLLPASAMARTSSRGCSYRYFQQSIAINGRDVTVESYQPIGAGSFPLVFMLHGSTGAFTLKSRREPDEDNFGERTLARDCFAVVLPHYLEAIGRKSITSRQEILTQFPAMLAATDKLLTHAEAAPRAKGEPVFLFGESLGGYLSVALAFRRSEVKAISEFSGGLPSGYPLSRHSDLRVLISHGTEDNIVPVLEAKELGQFCVAHNIPVKLNLYPGEGHYLSRATMSQIIGRTIEFFRSGGSLPADSAHFHHE